MIYSIVKFRHSQGAVAANFDHSTRAEIVWTVIPIVILVAMAVPAAATLVRIEDTRNSDLTIKVTGYQWRWHYEYLDRNVALLLDAGPRQRRRAPARFRHRSATRCRNYLLDVDNPLVVPVDKKVRVLLTAGDVIHAWWVPAFGMKKDAIPGFVNEIWFRADQVGIYRGQCAELCGTDHGFMPVVVDVRSQEDFDSWLKAQQDARRRRMQRRDCARRRSNEFMSTSSIAHHQPADPVHEHHEDAHHDDHGPDKGWRRWVLATNHKDIGTLYLLFSLLMFFVGGAMAMVIRAELFKPGMQLVDPMFFNPMTTMHALIMIFGAVMPAFVGLANWMIPLQIGAPDMALPRMNNWSASGSCRSPFTPAARHAVRARRRAGRRLDACIRRCRCRPATRSRC